MTYHYPTPSRPAVPVPYSLVPLAQALPPAHPEPTILGIRRDLFILIAVVLVVIAVMWWIDQQDQKKLTPNRSRAKKQSTAEMAKNLYKRLEGRGGVNDTTLRSLQQLGRRRAT